MHTAAPSDSSPCPPGIELGRTSSTGAQRGTCAGSSPLPSSLAVVGGSFALAAPTRGAEEAATKVAIIVGPVGEELTPVYLALAEAAATAAEDRGATVARAYSPDATAENVLAAVKDANVVVYFGHGVGSPNPYSATPNPATTNGWGLNGPATRGDHATSWRDGTLAYYGEAWIVAARASRRPAG